MGVFGDRTVPGNLTWTGIGPNRCYVSKVTADPGLLTAVAMWFRSDLVGPPTDEKAFAVIYDARSRALVATTGPLTIVGGLPLKLVTFTVLGGVYWKGGDLLVGIQGADDLDSLVSVAVVNGSAVSNLVINANFEFVDPDGTPHIDAGWTSSNSVGPTQLRSANIPELSIGPVPELRNAGAQVTVSNSTAAGTWRPITPTESGPELFNGTAAIVPGSQAGPLSRVAIRVRVVVGQQCVNMGQLKLVARTYKAGVGGNGLFDTEIVVATTAAALSTYPAGTVLDLSGFANLPATSDFGCGIGLSVPITAAGAHGSLFVGKIAGTVDFTSPTVGPWFDGNEPGYLWWGFERQSRSGIGTGVFGGSAGVPAPLAIGLFPAERLPFFLVTSGEQRTPDIPDEELAAYGWNTAQKMLAGPVTGAPLAAATAEWHHTTLDPHEGAFALVRSGGPLEELVGDVIRVSHGGRSLYAYVVDATDDLDADLSLARRAFLALDDLSLDEVSVTVEVTAGAAVS